MVSKQFYIIAYDISGNKRRSRVVKILEAYGTRMNKSVFECFILPVTYIKIVKLISDVIDPKKDAVLYYPICKDCMVKSKKTFRDTNLPGLIVV
jgi:CRISPR-associated protein Cas2